MYYTIYEVRNKVNGKTYIGKHQTDNIYDEYLGSGRILKHAINKYGKDCFEKIVLHVFDNKKDMDDKEAELVTDDEVKNKMIYNLKRGGEGGWDHIYKNPKIATEVGKKGYDNGLALLTKNERSENGKKSYEKTLLTYVKSNDPEIKKRRSENSGKTFKGKHHTNETKEKMKQTQKNINRSGIKNPMYGKCWIYNDVECTRVDKNNIDEYLQKGWHKGRKIKI